MYFGKCVGEFEIWSCSQNPHFIASQMVKLLMEQSHFHHGFSVMEFSKFEILCVQFLSVQDVHRSHCLGLEDVVRQ